MIDAFTSHWRNCDLANLDCQPVSISRGQPRWPLPFRYRRFDALAPDDRTWATKTEEAFERGYLDQLEALGAATILARLEEITGDLSAVLLCWEKPGEWCHRRMLADFLREQTGLVVPELEPGDLPRRDDAIQRSLF